MDEPKRRPADDPLLAFVLDVGQHAPEVAGDLDQLADLVALLLVTVAVGGRVVDLTEPTETRCE